MPFVNLNSDTALISAGTMRERILGKPYPYGDILNMEDALYPNDDFMKKALKPDKVTILHLVIESYLWEEWNYSRRKHHSFVIEAQELLNLYKVEFKINTTDYENYLFHKVEKLLLKEAHEIFIILFEDRELMRQFNILVTKTIITLSMSDFPNYLVKDGRVKRCGYWATWLMPVLVNREKGRCAICGCDLTNVVYNDKKTHIDHIVPLSNGGTNDTTNLQVLCEECNLKKGNRSNETNAIRHIPWELPE